MEKFICDCGHVESPHSDFTRGYGTDSEGKTHCYDCCTNQDKEFMRKNGKISLYLVEREDGYHIVNWPGVLDIKVKYYKFGHHNIAGKRVDVWFTFEGENWHGYQIGQYNEICHCKRMK